MSTRHSAQPDVNTELLRSGIKELGLDLSELQVGQLKTYLELLIKWNQAYNLTAIREPKQMIIKHLLDALSVLPYIKEGPVLDVGTGPGIPGVMLAIARPDLKFTLVDSNGKKIRFIKQVQRTLDLPNLDAIQSRVEELPAEQKFQQIVSRAFTALHQMVKVCHHLLDEGGEFIAMKGTYPEPNQQPLDQQWKIAEAIELYVPFLDEQRHLVVVHRSIGKESLSQEKE